jgi:hypothetical protein
VVSAHHGHTMCCMCVSVCVCVCVQRPSQGGYHSELVSLSLSFSLSLARALSPSRALSLGQRALCLFLALLGVQHRGPYHGDWETEVAEGVRASVSRGTRGPYHGDFLLEQRAEGLRV